MERLRLQVDTTLCRQSSKVAHIQSRSRIPSLCSINVASKCHMPLAISGSDIRSRRAFFKKWRRRCSPSPRVRFHCSGHLKSASSKQTIPPVMFMFQGRISPEFCDLDSLFLFPSVARGVDLREKTWFQQEFSVSY